MENASKALIIAGAILISIVIITLGIYVIGGARKTITGQNLDAQEVQSFNEKFEIYIGDRKSPADIRSMYGAVISSNAAESNTGKQRYINITNTGVATNGAQAALPTLTVPDATAIPSTHTYTIRAGYDPNTGALTNLDWIQD